MSSPPPPPWSDDPEPRDNDVVWIGKTGRTDTPSRILVNESQVMQWLAEKPGRTAWRVKITDVTCVHLVVPDAYLEDDHG